MGLGKWELVVDFSQQWFERRKGRGVRQSDDGKRVVRVKFYELKRIGGKWFIERRERKWRFIFFKTLTWFSFLLLNTYVEYLFVCWHSSQPTLLNGFDEMFSMLLITVKKMWGNFVRNCGVLNTLYQVDFGKYEVVYKEKTREKKANGGISMQSIAEKIFKPRWCESGMNNTNRGERKVKENKIRHIYAHGKLPAGCRE